MGVLTTAQASAMRRVQAIANDVLPRIEFLEALAGVSPELAARVRDLRTQREYLYNLALTALELDRSIGSGMPVSTPLLPPPPPPPKTAGTAGGDYSSVPDPTRPYGVWQEYFAELPRDQWMIDRATALGRVINPMPGDTTGMKYTWRGGLNDLDKR